MQSCRYIFYVLGGLCFMGIFYLSYSTMHKLNEGIDGLTFINQKTADQQSIIFRLQALNEIREAGGRLPQSFNITPDENEPLTYENAPSALLNSTPFRKAIVQHGELSKALSRFNRTANIASAISPTLNAAKSTLNELKNTRNHLSLELKRSLSTYVWLSGLTTALAALLIGLPFAAQHRMALQGTQEANKRLKLKAQELSATHNTMGNMLEDIIYQRRQATRTEENNARLASIINSADDAILSLNMTGVIVTANPAAEKLFGEDLVGRRFHHLFENPFSSQIRAMILATQEQNSGATFDVSHYADNQKVDLSLTVSPIRSEPDNLVGFSVIAKNFSSASQEQEKFRLAVEAAPNPMLMVNRHGHIILANSEVENLFGYTQEELYGQPIHLLVPSNLRKDHVEHVAHYLKDPVKRNLFDNAFKLKGQRKDESRFPVEISLTPIEMEGDTFVICSIINISDRLSHQVKLQDLNKELSRKNEELEQFIYAVSHDLKAPLVTITGFAQRLIDDPVLSGFEKPLHKLNRILSNAKAMDTLLKDLLDLSRVIKRNLDKSELDAENIINQVIRSLETQIKNDPVEIQIMPPFYGIYAQESLLKQCLQNIVANAIKYRRQDVSTVVKIMPFGDLNYTGVVIEDNGIGIPEEHQKRVFTVFERLQPHLCEGTGVGLTIVKTIMEKHGGKITLHSTEGEGSQFILMFPRNQVTNNDAG